MTSGATSEKAAKYLRRLCRETPSRRVGSKGNRAATDFFAGITASFAFETESPAFDCIDWIPEGVHLTVDGVPFEVFVSPYSLSCHVMAPFIVVSTVEELKAAEVANGIILLHGHIAREQLMPKNFPFYNPDEHKRIIQLLEMKKPQAIMAATSRDVEMAGAVYPFPLIEDGDFDIPSVYMTEEEGNRLAEYAGMEVSLDIRANRFPATGCNVIARKGADPNRRVVLFAHIDAKDGTPGATDNAAGVIVLLLLAELLSDVIHLVASASLQVCSGGRTPAHLFFVVLFFLPLRFGLVGHEGGEGGRVQKRGVVSKGRPAGLWAKRACIRKMTNARKHTKTCREHKSHAMKDRPQPRMDV